MNKLMCAAALVAFVSGKAFSFHNDHLLDAQQEKRNLLSASINRLIQMYDADPNLGRYQDTVGYRVLRDAMESLGEPSAQQAQLSSGTSYHEESKSSQEEQPNMRRVSGRIEIMNPGAGTLDQVKDG